MRTTVDRRVTRAVFAEAAQQKIKIRKLAELTGIEQVRLYRLSSANGAMQISELYLISRALGRSMESFVWEALADGQREV